MQSLVLGLNRNLLLHQMKANFTPVGISGETLLGMACP